MEPANLSADRVLDDAQRSSVRDGQGQPQTAAHSATALADLTLIVADLYKVRRDHLQAEGDMERRIKSKARSSASERMRAMGLEPEPGKLPVPTDEDFAVVQRVYPSFFRGRDGCRADRKEVEKQLIERTARLPVMAWASTVRGLGLLSVATLVGEAKDPGRYSTPSRLWKRYGLAVIDGRSQRRVADAEQAARHGYNAERRAAIYVIGENMIRARNPEARRIYDEVKARELLKVDQNGEPLTKGHAHKRALRIIQKRLVLAFWLAWRQTAAGEPLSEKPRAWMAGE